MALRSESQTHTARTQLPLSPLLVNYEYPGITENCGGGGRVTEVLSEELRAAGHTPQIVTDEADGHYATFPIRSYRRLNRRISRDQPSLLHGHFTLPTSVLLPRLARKHNLPLVVSAMGADVYDPTRFSRVRPVANLINSRIFDAADAVVAPSSDMQRRIARTYSTPCRRISYGIPTDRWTWKRRAHPESPTILSVCRLVERKGLPTGVRAVEQLRNSNVDATYRIVGTGPQRDRLDELAAEREWLDVAGYAEDLQAEYDSADIIFLPSKHEAFGMVFLEALACGLPAVTTDTGGQNDIVTDDVGAVCARTPEMLARGLRDVYDNYEWRQEATQGYVAENFSAAQMAAEYGSLYGDVLRR